MSRLRLREARLSGFKTFADKTTIAFTPGITAIVGPNGSGKSNIVDALRWALGEAGRGIRSKRVDEVIFAGSEKRRQLGLAEVSLSIANDDGLFDLPFTEIEIARRADRGGGQEYLLNRERIRLRDLNDLLDGAGLAENGLLFIGQGAVDQALSLRAEERRALVEEFAGTARHERRRARAEAEMKEATENRARVEEILSALRPQERRLAALARQEAGRDELLTEAVLREGFQPEMGARPLIRALRRIVLEPLAEIAPSPITAITLRRSPFRSRATAMPSPAEIEVEECAAPKGSYTLSARLVKPESPPPWRSVRMRSRRPVRILCG